MYYLLVVSKQGNGLWRFILFDQHGNSIEPPKWSPETLVVEDDYILAAMALVYLNYTCEKLGLELVSCTYETLNDASVGSNDKYRFTYYLRKKHRILF